MHILNPRSDCSFHRKSSKQYLFLYIEISAYHTILDTCSFSFLSLIQYFGKCFSYVKLQFRLISNLFTIYIQLSFSRRLISSLMRLRPNILLCSRLLIFQNYCVADKLIRLHPRLSIFPCITIADCTTWVCLAQAVCTLLRERSVLELYLRALGLTIVSKFVHPHQALVLM